MDLEEKIKLFITFLKKEKCYENYRYNIQKNDNALRNSICGKDINIKSIFLNCDTLHVITRPFVWHETKEGFKYWYDIERKWYKFILNKHS